MLMISILVYLTTIFILAILGKYNKTISDVINEPESGLVTSNMCLYLFFMLIPIFQQIQLILVIIIILEHFLTKFLTKKE